MKRKIYSTLLIAFAFTATTFVSVNADTETTVIPTSETIVDTTTATEADTTTDADNVIDVNQSVKVNKKIKLKNTLNIDSDTLQNLSFSTDNSKVAKVSSSGTVTGLKKGTATVTVTSDVDNSVYATVNVDVKSSYTESQLRYMASIIYCEAWGEPYAGKKAVGIVVMNRINSSLYPNTIRKVLYQKGQFTPARNGSLNKALTLYDKGKLDVDCIAAAKEALDGTKSVTYKGKNINMSNTLFFSRYIYKSKFKIAHHMFK